MKFTAFYEISPHLTKIKAFGFKYGFVEVDAFTANIALPLVDP